MSRSVTTGPAVGGHDACCETWSRHVADELISAGCPRPGGRAPDPRWILLDPVAGQLYVDWAQIASEMVAILRLDAGAHPDDARTTELVGELTLNSPEFSRWWSQHKVLIAAGATNGSTTPSSVPWKSATRRSTCPVTRTRPCSSTVPLTPDTGSAEALKLLASWNAQTPPRVLG
jgi:hypothetical protein